MTYIEAMNVVFDHLWSGVTSEFGRIEEYNRKILGEHLER